MRQQLRPWAAATVLLLGDLVASRDAAGAAGEGLQLHITCFNFETVQVTWNATGHPGTNLTFFYTFTRGAGHRPCTNYTLWRGHTSGCLLAARDDILYFSVRNGSRLLVSRSQWLSDYLKPSSPKDVHFRWLQEDVLVTCSDLPYGGLLYEVQYRSRFDAEWESREATTCNVTVGGLDTQKCYSFRTRVKTTEDQYGPHATPSDWSQVTHWQRAELRDSCEEEPGPRRTRFPKFILISSSVTLLTLCLLLLSLWRLQRVKKLLVPSVPDPKGKFPGLFEQHQGNFQAWITDTQNVVLLAKAGGLEPETPPEEALVIHLLKTEPEAPASPGPACLQTGEEEAPGGSPQLPPQAPQGGDRVFLGDFAFVMSDNSYMML
ncbi:cytokine receptor-like factor 2 isoform X1 [Marmota flaviventris]|uniref:cytokine receptor-like factor 2 isoform X1 n=1 Tax=Marmota flaviventris TaxID=93162 RepID=UPI003A837105